LLGFGESRFELRRARGGLAVCLSAGRERHADQRHANQQRESTAEGELAGGGWMPTSEA